MQRAERLTADERLTRLAECYPRCCHTLRLVPYPLDFARLRIGMLGLRFVAPLIPILFVTAVSLAGDVLPNALWLPELAALLLALILAAAATTSAMLGQIATAAVRTALADMRGAGEQSEEVADRR